MRGVPGEPPGLVVANVEPPEALGTYAEPESGQQPDLLRACVSQLNDAVMITTAGGADARIEFVNDAFVRITGYPRSELLGLNPGLNPGLLHGLMTDRAELERIGAAMSRFEPVGGELLCYRKNGKPYWVELDTVPVTTPAAVCSHFVTVMRDVTRRRFDADAAQALKLEQELESRVAARTAELSAAREKADAANSAKSAFLAAMSHEIRTPMNGVVGMIDVLEQSDLGKSQAEMVRTIRQSAYALLKVVDEVLDFSKIEAGFFEIDEAAMSIEATVEAACDTLAQLAASKAIDLRMFIDPAIPRQTRGHAARLGQVLLNLIGNALKFSSAPDRRGVVRVRAGWVDHGADGATIEISVADDGIGMDAVVRSRLFTPFTQADSGTSLRYGGTGLGLSISRRLVELMGGAIEVQSEAGVGSTFTLTLPGLVVEESCLKRPVPAGSPAARGCLMVSADESLADDLQCYLSHDGWLVSRARNRSDVGAWLEVAAPGPHAVVVAGMAAAVAATVAECRTLVAQHPHLQLRYVAVEHGERGDSGALAGDTDRLEAAALHRATLVAVVATAAGRSADLASDENRGACDTIAAPREAAGPRPARRSILVAEDNELNQVVLKAQLRLLGHDAEVVSSGEEALRRWRQGGYALLLTDLHMPGLDGYDLTQTIRREERIGGRGRLPIIGLTADALSGEARRCADLGMDGHMTKPLQLGELRLLLTRWLGAACPAVAPLDRPASS